MKKQNKKNNRAGRNVFGQKCITKEVTLNKETALEQYLEVLNDIEQHRQLGINIEYDVKLPTDATRQAWDFEDQHEPMRLRYYQQLEEERLLQIEKEDAISEIKFKSEVRVKK